MASPPKCGQTGGTSEASNGDRVHTHTCFEDRGHSGPHQCTACPYTW
jgi:hypothetical protein